MRLRRSSHPAPQELTRVGLVVAPRPRRHGKLIGGAVLALALGVGIALALPHVRPPAAAPEVAQWQQQIEQQRLALGMAESNANELKRQIDTLNQQLRESREELTFFRQARDAKR